VGESREGCSVWSMAHRPKGYHTVTPRAVVGDLTGAVAFLRATFQATGELVEGRPAELRIGDSLLMVSEAGERDPFPAFLYVYVDDVDRVYERALAAGARTIEAPAQTPYGDRRAMVEDPFGDVFQIAAPARGGGSSEPGR
jgi:PhnB protein